MKKTMQKHGSRNIGNEKQVEVMERIFGENSDYSEETRNELKRVMLVSEQDSVDILYMEKREWEKPGALLLMHASQDLRKIRKEIYIFVCILGAQTAWMYPVHWRGK